MEAQDQRRQAFLTRFLSVESALRGYILTHVCNFTLAEDLLQQSALVLWEKFEQYDPQRPFLAWALGVARLEILETQRGRERSHVLLDTDLEDRLAKSYEELEPELARRRQLVRTCVDRLSNSMQEAVRLRYDRGLDLEAVSRELGKSLSAVKVLLHRARLALERCVKLRLTSEEA